MNDLPSEDLADILEALSGREQQALFQALDSEKAAETLMEAEPRAQRQLIAALRRERAHTILSEMSVPQLADLLAVLPHDDKEKMLALLSPEEALRIRSILSERESTARALMSTDFVAMPRETRVGEALAAIRSSGHDHSAISYLYVVNGDAKFLDGVVDMRQLILSPDNATLEDIMSSPVVLAEEDDLRDDLADLFAKYHYRMLPVVDADGHILGVVHFSDIMKGLVARPRI